jgi:hypothetical protein
VAPRPIQQRRHILRFEQNGIRVPQAGAVLRPFQPAVAKINEKINWIGSIEIAPARRSR